MVPHPPRADYDPDRVPRRVKVALLLAPLGFLAVVYLPEVLARIAFALLTVLLVAGVIALGRQT